MNTYLVVNFVAITIWSRFPLASIQSPIHSSDSSFSIKEAPI